MTRRELLGAMAAAAGGPAMFAQTKAASVAAPTRFQIGCMNLPYRAFPLQRALEGIAKAGCRCIGWGGAHMEGGTRRRVLPLEAPPSEAKQLAQRCRDIGLEPALMFGGAGVDSPESIQRNTQRIKQASAARMPFVVTFGRTTRGNYGVWIRNLKQLAPIARAEGVTLALKPHGGNTGTGKDCSNIIADVGGDAIKICYDSGNVLDYEDVDPIPDIQACWRHVVAFAIKDHRNTPKDQDCGPGLGEIDHYKLLTPVLRTGLTIPLVCENIFEPLLPRPKSPEGTDRLVRRAVEFLDTVVRGLQTA
jgi:sugar phosphate isomerase/epimerase